MPLGKVANEGVSSITVSFRYKNIVDLYGRWQSHMLPVSASGQTELVFGENFKTLVVESVA